GRDRGRRGTGRPRGLRPRPAGPHRPAGPVRHRPRGRRRRARRARHGAPGRAVGGIGLGRAGGGRPHGGARPRRWLDQCVAPYSLLGHLRLRARRGRSARRPGGEPGHRRGHHRRAGGGRPARRRTDRPREGRAGGGCRGDAVGSPRRVAPLEAVPGAGVGGPQPRRRGRRGGGRAGRRGRLARPLGLSRRAPHLPGGGRRGGRRRRPGPGGDRPRRPPPAAGGGHAGAVGGAAPGAARPRPADVTGGLGAAELVRLGAAAEAAARLGGRVVAEHFGGLTAGVVSKAPGDYVSEVDLRSEQTIREALARDAPGIAFFGEEGGGSRGDLWWVVDPLDGTANFLHGFPVVGVSVALVEAGRPVAGAVHAPLLG